jgi:hypothetical protein
MQTEVLSPSTSPSDVKKHSARVLQTAKHVAKYLLITLLLVATAVVVYVAL